MVQWLKELVPVHLLFSDVMMEVWRDVPVVTIALLVGVGMIRGLRITSNTENVTYGLPEFGTELGTAVQQNGVRYPIRYNKVIKHHQS